LAEDGPGLVDEDNNEFGLTQADYELLIWDIQNEIAKFNEEHGRVCISRQHIKRRLSAQDIAIAKGLIQIRADKGRRKGNKAIY
jgi:hypothetical protein